MGSKNFDFAVIGAGIIGLSVAMRIVAEMPNASVVILEKEQKIASHQTGHNSGVIHAGIYYAPGSQKAAFCYSGSKALRNYCKAKEIPFEMVGKLIIATDASEIPALDELFLRGSENGVDGLRVVGEDEIRSIEPYSAGVRGIFSPNTGIINYQQVTQAYADDFRDLDGEIVLDAAVKHISRSSGKLILESTNGDYSVSYIVNCAGLYADKIAEMMGEKLAVRIIPFRGEYFLINPESSTKVNGLIYPVPDPQMPFLGVHLTRRIDGAVEAGPSAVMAFRREGYRKSDFHLQEFFETLVFSGFWKMGRRNFRSGVSEMYRSLSKQVFLKSVQKLIPSITKHDLTSPGAGVRAQAVDSMGNILQDFSILQTNDAIHVLSAPSPAATCSLLIGSHITEMVKKNFSL
jgi:L-2-hydroxyglutarate oxidase